jgi:transcriptional regulator with AAA-type ATPase domain/tetratricopeptide (TPR) repeat protein
MNPLVELLGESPAIAAVRENLRRVLRHQEGGHRLPPVLIQGETGTGKGLVARLIHRNGPRASRPFVDVNCATIPDTLLEAELFGFERGAFTDARQAKPGLLQLAHGGFLFLDEVGLLSIVVQGKLLKVLEERTVRRLGSTRDQPVDVSMITATNEDLAAAMRGGRFREDLYHRIAVVTLSLPPLRERVGDSVLLAEHFVTRACSDYGLPPKTFAPEALAALEAYPWPGNVRELNNVVERAVLLSNTAMITKEMLGLAPDVVPRSPGTTGGPRSEIKSLRSAIRDHLLEVLTQTGWNISRTAAQLEVSRNTVAARIRRFGLRPPTPAHPGDPGRAPEPELPAPEHPLPRAPARASGWEPRRMAVLQARIVVTPETSAWTSPWLEALRERVLAFGGCVDGLGPTGLFATFGLEPTDEPVSVAAHAALAIQRAAARRHSHGESRPDVKLAIHSAKILVGGPRDHVDLDADGRREAWNALEGLLESCAPNETVVSPAASAFLRQRFELAPMAPGGAGHRLVGIEGTGAYFAHRRVQFVGRRQEIELLLNQFHSTAAGRGHVVEVVGDAGLGKSRLVLELVRALEPGAATVLEARCFQFASGVPYFPVTGLVRAVCAITDLDSPGSLKEKLEDALAKARLPVTETASYLLTLFRSDEGAASGGTIEPAKLQERIFETVRGLLLALSADRPLLVVVEDLHWMDATSEGFFASLVDALPGARVFLVLTYRPGYRTRWLDRGHVTKIALQPLSPVESFAVVREVLEADPPPETLASLIVARAEGNPLFLEELALAVRDAADASVEVGVPETIQEVLLARLGRLRPEHRHLLTVAAVIGKDVPLSVLRAVMAAPDSLLQEGLGELQRLEFLLPMGVEAGIALTFKHALTHEVAYGSVETGQRRALHRRIVAAIEALYAERLVEQTERLAYHALMGELWAKAVSYLGRAARRAIERSANVEAVAYVRKGLDALPNLPATSERSRQELDLTVSLVVPLIALRGYTSPDVERTFTRAYELCREVGETPALANVVWAQWAFHLVRGNLQEALEKAREYAALAEKAQTVELLLETRQLMGLSLFHLGQLTAARPHLEHGMALYDPAAHHVLIFQHGGVDTGVAMQTHLAVALWLLGYPAEGRTVMAEALELAERLSHPLSHAYAHFFAAWMHVLCGDAQGARRSSEAAVAICAEGGFAFWGAIASELHGCVLTEQGVADEALAQMRQAQAVLDGIGARLFRIYPLGLMAKGYQTAGQPQAGLEVITRALALVEATGDCSWEAELRRIHGEIVLAEGRGEEEAEASFRQAIEIARERSEKSLELRAAMSLARLRKRRGELADARRVLEPIYRWFTDGSDTKDLRDATALLADLPG